MEKVITDVRPAICEVGINGFKTFNIGIRKVRNKEEFECTSHSVRNPSIVDVVPAFVEEGLEFSVNEVEAIKENCSASSFSKLVSALVRTRYTADDVEAIILNLGDGDSQHEAEFAELQEWRRNAKDVAHLFVDESK